MHSKPLQQAINVTLDTMSMRGPVTVRDVAEEVDRSAPVEYWTSLDEKEARIGHLCRHIKQEMAEGLSAEYVEKYMPHIPDDLVGMFKGFPRYICINPRGGTGAQHVLTILATQDQWANNIKLKDRVIDATTGSRNRSRDFFLMLKESGASSLLELFEKGT